MPLGAYWDSGRNILAEPGVSSTDFAALKGFRFKERYNLQFRSEFFNLSNIRHFRCTNTTGAASALDNDATSSAFRQIRTAGPAGEIQFALKLIWQHAVGGLRQPLEEIEQWPSIILRLRK